MNEPPPSAVPSGALAALGKQASAAPSFDGLTKRLALDMAATPAMQSVQRHVAEMMRPAAAQAAATALASSAEGLRRPDDIPPPEVWLPALRPVPPVLVEPVDPEPWIDRPSTLAVWMHRLERLLPIVLAAVGVAIGLGWLR
jgi:hypothetical protein